MTELDDFLALTVDWHAAAIADVRKGDPAAFLGPVVDPRPSDAFPASQPRWLIGTPSATDREVAAMYSGSADVEPEVLAPGAPALVSIEATRWAVLLRAGQSP